VAAGDVPPAGRPARRQAGLPGGGPSDLADGACAVVRSAPLPGRRGRLLSPDGQGPPEGQVGAAAAEAGLRRRSHAGPTSRLSQHDRIPTNAFSWERNFREPEGGLDPGRFLCHHFIFKVKASPDLIFDGPPGIRYSVCDPPPDRLPARPGQVYLEL